MAQTMRCADPATGNRMLAALTDQQHSDVTAHLMPVWLVSGEVLCEPDKSLTQIYFPVSALVSLLHRKADGTAVKMALIGNEGVVGVALSIGDLYAPCRAVVSRSGWAYVLSGPRLKEATDRSNTLLQWLLRYTQRLVAQMAQSTLCASQHSTDERVCRWLLQRLDRLDGDEVNVTHTAMADAVGVPSAVLGVSLAVLRANGLLHYSQGHITVVDRAGIEARVCECYHLMAQQPPEPRVSPR